MMINTDVIVKLNFVLSGNCASFLLASYLDIKQFMLNSLSKQVPFLVDFLLWHNSHNIESITQESTESYITELYSTKAKSYADVIRSYLRSFCAFLSSKEIIPDISFDTRPKGKTEDPTKLHKVFNYYKYLGISKRADLSEIKRAYHNKARTLHPDMNQDDPNATNRVMALNKMYDILKNEADRLAYDVAMGYSDYDDDYLDSLEGISWHDKEFYFIWI